MDKDVIEIYDDGGDYYRRSILNPNGEVSQSWFVNQCVTQNLCCWSCKEKMKVYSEKIDDPLRAVVFTNARLPLDLMRNQDDINSRRRHNSYIICSHCHRSEIQKIRETSRR